MYVDWFFHDLIKSSYINRSNFVIRTDKTITVRIKDTACLINDLTITCFLI